MRTALIDGSGTGPKPGQIVYDITMLSDAESEMAGKILTLSPGYRPTECLLQMSALSRQGQEF